MIVQSRDQRHVATSFDARFMTGAQNLVASGLGQQRRAVNHAHLAIGCGDAIELLRIEQEPLLRRVWLGCPRLASRCNQCKLRAHKIFQMMG